MQKGDKSILPFNAKSIFPFNAHSPDELISSASNKLFSFPGKWVMHSNRRTSSTRQVGQKHLRESRYKGSDIWSDWYESTGY